MTLTSYLRIRWRCRKLEVSREIVSVRSVVDASTALSYNQPCYRSVHRAYL
jgi:hypothetical protein